jgi:hypothetical protein
MTSAAVVSVAILVCTLLALEAGFRWGRHEIGRKALAHEGIGTVEASVFALLGLLLAFSFAGATARLEAKRELIVAEANAIGTAYRRIELLPPDAQASMRQEFRRLIEARIRAYEGRFDPAGVERDLRVIGETQDRMWSLALAATVASRDLALLVLPPLNEMIDVGTARAVALETHLPTLILGLLVGAAVSSGLLAGYGMAKRRDRSWFHGVAYAALLALTVYTVIDLDHPRFGLINIDAAYRPLIELRGAIK